MVLYDGETRHYDIGVGLVVICKKPFFLSFWFMIVYDLFVCVSCCPFQNYLAYRVRND